MSVHASPIAQGVPHLLCSAAFLLKTLECFKWAKMKACKAIYATKTLSLRPHFRYLYSSVFDWIHYLLIYLICSASTFAPFIWLLPSIPIFNHGSHCNCQTGNLTQKIRATWETFDPSNCLATWGQLCVCLCLCECLCTWSENLLYPVLLISYFPISWRITSCSICL